MANETLWDPATGLNQLATLEVDPAAPGGTDPTATAFEALP